jgi:hypothetical protein
MRLWPRVLVTNNSFWMDDSLEWYPLDWKKERREKVALIE